MKTEERKKTHMTVSCEITRAFNEQLRTAAFKENISKSELIKRALTEYLYNHNL